MIKGLRFDHHMDSAVILLKILETYQTSRANCSVHDKIEIASLAALKYPQVGRRDRYECTRCSVADAIGGITDERRAVTYIANK